MTNCETPATSTWADVLFTAPCVSLSWLGAMKPALPQMFRAGGAAASVNTAVQMNLEALLNLFISLSGFSVPSVDVIDRMTGCGLLDGPACELHFAEVFNLTRAVDLADVLQVLKEPGITLLLALEWLPFDTLGTQKATSSRLKRMLKDHAPEHLLLSQHPACRRDALCGCPRATTAHFYVSSDGDGEHTGEHVDLEDVIVWQMLGEKEWTFEVPSSHLRHQVTVLRPGDVLWLPAGTRHSVSALSRGPPSVHVSFEPISRRDCEGTV